MMFCFVPAWNVPTVTTARSDGATSRDTIVCRRTTIEAASTIGSIVFSGCDPWPPRPCTVTMTWSLPAMTGPGAVKTSPAAPGKTCWPSAMSMPSGSSSRSPSCIVSAPVMSSSAGWKTATIVPDQSSCSASTRRAPCSDAMWVSWPHACMTPTRWPSQSSVSVER